MSPGENWEKDVYGEEDLDEQFNVEGKQFANTRPSGDDSRRKLGEGP